MSEFVLPPSIVSKADFLRLVNELERVDDELTTSAVRSKVGADGGAQPTMNQALTDFLQVNELHIGDTAERTQLLKQMNTMKNGLPIVHMTFASEADRESLGQLALWLRTEVHPQAVIDVGLQPGLVAGVYLRTANKVFDLSLKGALAGGREILTKELGALRG